MTTNNENKRFGAKVKELRLKYNFKQAELAEKIGIDAKHLSRIENGHHKPGLDIIQKLSKELNYNFIETKEVSINKFEGNVIYIKSLNILNSAVDDKQLNKYYEVLKLMQKLLKV